MVTLFSGVIKEWLIRFPRLSRCELFEEFIKNIDKEGLHARRPDCVACKQQGADQSVHLLCLISAFVFHSPESIIGEIATCYI